MFKEIPISETISSPISDCVIYLRPSVMTGWTSLTQAEAESIRVYADFNKTTELPRGVVGSDEIWLKKGTLSDGDSIYVDYDGVRSDYADTDTFGHQNVFRSAYAFYSHMYDLTDSSIKDETSNNNDGTKHSANDPNEQIAGIIGSSQATNEQGSYINIGSATSIDNIFDGGGTVGFWTNLDSLTNYSGGGGGFRYHVTSGGSDWFIGGFDSSGRYMELNYTFSGSNGQWGIDGTPFSINEDIFIVITYDNSSVSNDPVIYLNGSAASITEASTPSGTRSSDDTADKYLMSNASADRTVDGQQDETFFATEMFSADEVAALYSNQNDPANFFGTVVDATEESRIFIIS